MDSHFFYIKLYDLVSLATLFTGMTIALLLGFAKSPARAANLFLSLALAAIVLKSGGLTSLFLPALGPLLYLYVRRLTCTDKPFLQRDLLHFCLLPGGYWLPAWLVLISVIIYLYLSHRLINDFYDRLQPVLMDRPRFAFRRLKWALVLLGALCVLSCFNAYFLFAITFVLMLEGAGRLLKPDGAIQLTLPNNETNDAREKGRRLKEAVAAGRFYTDAELTLATLSVKLGIHPQELSRAMNLGLKKNFSDFVNEFRVREVSRKMRDPAYAHLTILGIAYESGFNSKTTFNRVFRELTGKTPLEYKKEVPINKLAPHAVLRPVLLRQETPKRKFMFRNYLKIAYRQLLRQKMYATVKIGGFAMGIAACLLIGLYIHNELTFDRFYPGADRIFRVVGDGEMSRGLAWPAPMSKAIQQDFPEVEFAGRMRLVNSYLGHAELRPAEASQNTYEQGIIYIDQSFFSAFKLPMVYGDGATALKEPRSLVISKTMAEKHYHGQNPLGRVMYIDNDRSHPYRIGGVMADIPANSHLHPFHFFITLSGMEFGTGEQNSWRWYNYVQYIKLKSGTNVAAFEAKLNAGLRKNYLVAEARKGGAQDPAKEAAKFHVYLQPVPDINLYSTDFPDGLTNGDIRFVWLFGAIALFILIIACINFINLSTAKSANRAKEVGLRKVVGSNRSSLIAQFLTESLIYSFVSFILGILIAWLLLPYFNTMAARSLAMPWLEWWFVPVILLSTLVIGTLAGLYPAFYLSGFNPGQVLKGTISAGSKSPVLRNGLVVFQFAASVILIISTVVIYNQMHFILNRKAGFDKDQVMILQSTNTLSDQHIRNFKTELSNLSAVKSVSISDYLPVSGTSRNGNAFFKEGREKIDHPVFGQIWQVDDTYLGTLGIKLLEGRDFSLEMADDTAGRTVIINQSMARSLGLQHPVGARISDNGLITVIGVMQDFNYESVRSEIGPVALHYGLSNSMMTVKLRGGDVKNTIANVAALWKKYSPDQPIRYTFLDEDFANMYADLTRTGKIFTSFAVLAIIIACLGLFALSAFLAEQRSKEIGIRKVLGASVQGITTLLSVDFIKLVLLAILIASPIAWWAMHKWLRDFAYRVAISWWMFAIAGLGVILIAVVTVSFQSIKAAMANPVKSLRSE
ncbi:putative ABC transport system permease protein [Mucilaginibacter pineti]|uniref:Putative ABC transport system permease protein n=1 Tax=Mucilaginibacter pineti TaxID=1391627 RepID=A0A1G7NJ00_9SPHI|nr:ABC transporter permease [Mucilaginibacter pineti]SDF73922.1 putative ABC transport system permease protein [Mucilaginibacter pineti]